MKVHNLLIGFTGSVASVLSEKVCKSFLSKYNIKVVLTEAAKQFVDIEKICKLGCEVLTDKNEFYLNINDSRELQTNLELVKNVERKIYHKDDPILHIKLREWADCFLIAPCSAHTLAKIANGYCDNLLTSVARAWDFKSKKKIIIAPAANCKMWEHPITQEHMKKIGSWGIKFVYPIRKKLACGETGIGAMADIKDIVFTIDFLNSL